MTSQTITNQERENEILKSFIGIDELLEKFSKQLEHFKEWDKQKDWLAFHHHHYDWWMFPIDEKSSHGYAYTLSNDVIYYLREDRQFIDNLRLGVELMVRSWGWDIKNAGSYKQLDDKQKWSYWPVRLYKAGKCMWLFGQNDYYQSLRKLAERIKYKDHEKLDYFSHTLNGKADVLEQWDEMERRSY